MFHQQNIPGLRKSLDGNSRILFQVNDPNVLLGDYTHSGTAYVLPRTIRKPGVVIISYDAAIQSVNKQKLEGHRKNHNDCLSARALAPLTWETYCSTLALSSPTGSLRWANTLAAVEFKKKKKTIASGGNGLFWEEDYTHIPANPISATTFQSYVSPVALQSNSGGWGTTQSNSESQKTGPNVLDGQSHTPDMTSTESPSHTSSPPLLSHGTPTVQRTSDLKRSLEGHDEMSEPKRQRQQEYTQSHLTGWEQLAIYGGERLSSQANICHSLNILLEGETSYYI
jgi:hypothetical protein